MEKQSISETCCSYKFVTLKQYLAKMLDNNPKERALLQDLLNQVNRIICQNTDNQI